jgi:hypothetical protein
MSARWKLFSIFSWLRRAGRKSKIHPKCAGYCDSCRLPLERVHSIFTPFGRGAYCQVCRAMIATASTSFLIGVQQQFEEEQKRKKILTLGGNYLA